MRKIIKFILYVVVFVLQILLLLSFYSPKVSPLSFPLMPFLGLSFQYLLVAELIIIFILVLRGSRLTLLTLVVVALGYGRISNYMRISFKDNVVEKSDLKLVSYNVQNFYNTYGSIEENQKAVVDFLNGENADIICLQEVLLPESGEYTAMNIKNGIRSVRYFQLSHETKRTGALTLSRYPIIKLGEIEFSNSNNKVIFSDIVFPENDTVRVFNCHLASYTISPDEYDLIKGINNKTNEENREKFNSMFHKLKFGFERRALQTEVLRKKIDASPYRVILAGDLNDTPVSYTYEMLSDGFLDTFEEKGKGISPTYNGELPSFRIDYILLDQEFSCSDFERILIKRSDHYPIVSRFSLKKGD